MKTNSIENDKLITINSCTITTVIISDILQRGKHSADTVCADVLANVHP